MIEAPPTVSADVDAASRGDFAAMQASIRAERAGKPLARVERPVETAAPVAGEPAAPTTPAERTVSRAQQRTNDAIREATERATEELRAENERLRAAVRQPAAATTDARTAPATPAEPPAYKRIAALPHAPKLDDVGPDGRPMYETIEEHGIALKLFVDDVVASERRQHDTFDAQRARFEDQAKSFNDRLAATAAADADFKTKIAPALLAPEAVPLIALPAGPPATFVNVVAQAIWDGADPGRLLPHLHADGDKVASEIAELPSDQWLPALHRLDGRLAAEATPPTPAATPVAPASLPSTISAAPPPAPKVTGAGQTANPADSALARGDVGFFIRQEQERRAGRRSA